MLLPCLEPQFMRSPFLKGAHTRFDVPQSVKYLLVPLVDTDHLVLPVPTVERASHHHWVE